MLKIKLTAYIKRLFKANEKIDFYNPKLTKFEISQGIFAIN